MATWSLGQVERTFIHQDDPAIEDPLVPPRKAANSDSDSESCFNYQIVEKRFSWALGCWYLHKSKTKRACCSWRRRRVLSRLSDPVLMNVENFDIKNCLFCHLSRWMDARICASPPLICRDSQIGPCSFVLGFWSGCFVSVCPFRCQLLGTKVQRLVLGVENSPGCTHAHPPAPKRRDCF